MSEASLLLSLPDDVLKLVMRHVPARERLKSCCLVSKRLHAAAVAATQEVWACSRAAAAIFWLARYGQHVTYLKIFGFEYPLRELPCPSLLYLYLNSRSSVLLGPAAAAGGPPGVLQACTGLTSLELQCSALEDPAGVALEGLSDLFGLRSLTLWPLAPLTHGVSAATLPRLSHLTRLIVHGLSLDNVGQLGALSSLKELCLSAAGSVAVSPGSVPGLAFPAALTSLQLRSPVEGGVFSLVPTGLVKLRIDSEVMGPAGLFLSGIARLQHLTELALYPPTPPDWPPAGPAYAALTASSSLVALLLEVAFVLGALLPEGVWPFVFPAPRSLPHLTQLSLSEDGADLPADPAHWGPSWGAADVPSLVRCCPNLQDIHAMHLQHGSHVAELQKLTALTWLHVLYVVDEPEECESSLRHLGEVTQLQHLSVVMDGEGGTAAALLPLTQLEALTGFECSWLSAEEADDGDSDVNVYFHTTQDAEPDVYVQLLEHCANRVCGSDLHNAAVAEAVRSVTQMSTKQRQAAAESRSLVAGLQQQLAAQQRQLLDQQQQLEALQQQLLEQQQLIAAQQLAAQQQQIAALMESHAQAQSQSQPGQAAAAAGQGDLVASLQEQLEQQSLL